MKLVSSVFSFRNLWVTSIVIVRHVSRVFALILILNSPVSLGSPRRPEIYSDPNRSPPSLGSHLLSVSSLKTLTSDLLMPPPRLTHDALPLCLFLHRAGTSLLSPVQINLIPDFDVLRVNSKLTLLLEGRVRRAGEEV